MKGHYSVMWSPVFSPDSTHVITANNKDNTAIIWNTTTGQPTHTLQHNNWVNSAGFSPDSTQIITATEDNTAVIWAVNQHRQKPKCLNTALRATRIGILYRVKSRLGFDSEYDLQPDKPGQGSSPMPALHPNTTEQKWEWFASSEMRRNTNRSRHHTQPSLMITPVLTRKLINHNNPAKHLSAIATTSPPPHNKHTQHEQRLPVLGRDTPLQASHLPVGARQTWPNIPARDRPTSPQPQQVVQKHE